jgi:UDP-N-acetyl-D-galactosamine dehydrogenase
VDVVDPHASADEVMHEDGIEMVPKMGSDYVAVVLAVGHREFKEMGEDELNQMSNGELLLFDIKGIKAIKNCWKL